MDCSVIFLFFSFFSCDNTYLIHKTLCYTTSTHLIAHPNKSLIFAGKMLPQRWLFFLYKILRVYKMLLVCEDGELFFISKLLLPLHKPKHFNYDTLQPRRASR